MYVHVYCTWWLITYMYDESWVHISQICEPEFFTLLNDRKAVQELFGCRKTIEVDQKWESIILTFSWCTIVLIYFAFKISTWLNMCKMCVLIIWLTIYCFACFSYVAYAPAIATADDSVLNVSSGDCIINGFRELLGCAGTCRYIIHKHRAWCTYS